MRNPGLTSFGGPTTYVHPKVENIRRDDPDFDPEEEEEDPGRYDPPVNFGRWRTPGYTIRDVHVGPAFKPGETPEDVIHGEIITPEEQKAADDIINGDHDSSAPSVNPNVEQAREDLHTPGAADTVGTLSGLLRGRRPEDVGGLDEAHDWLSQHFTGVRVNPRQGTLLAQSPAGMQMVKRQQNLPAIPQAAPTYTLTNKHGEFTSEDPQRILRSMIAFQIVHNTIAAQQQKKKNDEEKKKDLALANTAGVGDWLKAGFPAKSKPRTDVPPGAVWEPHAAGEDVDAKGLPGGWVVRADDAPPGWKTIPETNTAISPGHALNEVINPEQNKTPWPDPVFKGHTFTYAKSPETGHTALVESQNANIWVKPDIHPLARGPKPPAATVPTTPPTAPPHPNPPANGGKMISSSSVQVNDLCPVCASGYLEPYDSTYHECLNCGSLVKHIGMEKGAALGDKRKPGGLGRGLGQIIDPGASAAGMGLDESGAANTEPPVDLDETQTHHPLFGAPPLSDEQQDEVYEAPRNLGAREAAVPDDDIDDFMGKQGFRAIHKPGQESIYLAHMPHGPEGSYLRLTQGAGGRGWVLSADHVPPVSEWRQGINPLRNIKLPVHNYPEGGREETRVMLPDPASRTMAEKSILATGTHPINDDALNRAIRDVAEHGRNSNTYQQVMDTAYEPPALPTGNTQRAMRGYSFANPGKARWTT